MSFETHARMEMQQLPDYELNKLSNGLGTRSPALNESPLSNQQLQQMADDQLFQRYQQVPLDQL